MAERRDVTGYRQSALARRLGEKLAVESAASITARRALVVRRKCRRMGRVDFFENRWKYGSGKQSLIFLLGSCFYILVGRSVDSGRYH